MAPKAQNSRLRWLRSHLSSFPSLSWWDLMPWFIAAPLGKTDRRLPKVSSTSYMNGLRGVASWIVFNYHIVAYYYLHEIPGGNLQDRFRGLIAITQYPLVNSLYTGKAMVCMFFVLSGFVLSYGHLRRAHNGAQADELVNNLASSVLRRGTRLFGPVLVVVFITAVVLCFNDTLLPPQLRTNNHNFVDQLLICITLISPLLNPFTWQRYVPEAFSPCWTLAYEFRGSMVVFLLCLMTLRLQHLARKTIVLFTAVVGLYFLRWEVFCFGCGMFLSELRFNPLSADFSFVVDVATRDMTTKGKALIRNCVFWPLLLFSWIICCAPDSAPFTKEPFTSLQPLAMGAYFEDWLTTVLFGSIGAVGVLACLENLPLMQRLLATKPLLYLGEISFAVYLMHWMLLFIVTHPVYQFLTFSLGFGVSLSFYISYFITLGVLIVVSDYFWRFVDQNCVLLSKFLVDYTTNINEYHNSSQGYQRLEPSPIEDQLERGAVVVTEAEAAEFCISEGSEDTLIVSDRESEKADEDHESDGGNGEWAAASAQEEPLQQPFQR